MNTAPAEVMKKASQSKLARRIVLDIVLILVLITLYSKNVISLMYHECAGLALFALFIIHLFLNRKWISGLLKRRIETRAKSKAMTVVNVLLVISWLTVMITGILVSKKVFAIQISSLNPIHFFAAALALIFTGVHFGLHWQYFWGFLGKRIQLPRVLAICLMIIVILFGCWQTANSSFSKWITAPFHTSSDAHGADRPEIPVIDTKATEIGNGNGPADQITADTSEEPADAGQTQGITGYGSKGGRNQQPFSILNLLNVIATYFSITFMFAALTRGIELLLKKSHVHKKS